MKVIQMPEHDTRWGRRFVAVHMPETWPERLRRALHLSPVFGWKTGITISGKAVWFELGPEVSP